MTRQEQSLQDKLATEAEDAEATRDAELPHQRRRRTGGQAVYGLRLPAERIEQLRQLAAARGVEPSVLARNWVIEHFDEAEAGARDLREEQWERDLRATTEHLRELLDERPGA
jgi:aryl-alcohol dehydrogenase-like predicted oxidoreductase